METDIVNPPAATVTITDCVVYFAETVYYTIIERRLLPETLAVGDVVPLTFPIRAKPFNAEVKQFCSSREEALEVVKKLEAAGPSPKSNDQPSSPCRQSPEQNSNDVAIYPPHNGPNYVTSNLFCDIMNRVVDVIKEMQASSEVRLEATANEMRKLRKVMTGTEGENEEPSDNSNGQNGQNMLLARPIVAPNSRWAPQAIVQTLPPIEDDTKPSFEFVSSERVDEVFEDSENYKIFARKISYCIFDETEQKLKLNERNKKKVSELRKLIKMKFPAQRREFDDMIWRTCKNAVNNTTYNEAKRRKRHPANDAMPSSSSQNFSPANYDPTYRPPETSSSTATNTTNNNSHVPINSVVYIENHSPQEVKPEPISAFPYPFCHPSS